MPEIPILDRKPYFDERSRDFAIRTLLKETKPLKRHVWTPKRIPLDQGREGRCVIFGWGGELACTPHKWPIDNSWCNQMWPKIQAEDRIMGNNWEDGASLLAGARVLRKTKHLNYYAWAFGIDDVLQTLMRKGPVILGVNWYEGMYRTNKYGLVELTGRLVGGHCILANGVIPNHQDMGDVVVWTNSWGPNYGINGRGFIRVKDLEELLRQDGEACIPTDIPVRV